MPVWITLILGDIAFMAQLCAKKYLNLMKTMFWGMKLIDQAGGAHINLQASFLHHFAC